MSDLSTPDVIGIVLGCWGGFFVILYIVCVIIGYRKDYAEDLKGLPVECENFESENSDQGIIQYNRRYLAKEDDRSFAEDARTIVGEENESDGSIYGGAEASSQGLTKDNGQQMTEQDKESFNKDGRTFTGEERDMKSVDVTETGYSEECHGVPKDDGQQSTRNSLGEENGRTSADLNEKGYCGRG